MPHFSIYGLHLQADVPVPGLLAAPSDWSADVGVWFQTSSPEITRLAALSQTRIYSSPGSHSAEQPVLQVWALGGREGFRFRYADGVEFVLDSAGTEIGVTWSEPMTLEDAATYLVGPVLSFVLRLRGVTCLHASAVAIDGRAVAFMGPPSAGKSTVAAAFVRKGLAGLTDDVVALTERDSLFWVQPGYPRMNLWADSAEVLSGSPNRLPLITPGWEKRFLELASSQNRFQASPLPLGAVYLLERSETPAAPKIEPVTGRTALIAVLANTSVNYMLDRSMRAREFSLAGSMISRVPMRRVCFSGLNALDSLVNAILADCQALNALSAR